MIETMSAPFHNVFADEFRIPVSSVRALIESCRARRQTGLVRLVSVEEESLYLLLKNGNVVNSYIVSPQTWKAVSLETWEDWIDSAGDAFARFIPLSIQGLIICKLLIQNTAGKTSTFTSASGISECLEAQKQASDSTLVYLDWKNAAGAVLFAGGASTPPYSLFVSSGSIYDQTDIAPVIIDTEHSKCTATIIHLDPSVDAWQEYLLRRVFTNVCEHILATLQTLTGQALVASLVRLINIFAFRRSLSIEILSRKVVDHELFSSPEQAADNYRLLLTEMLIHFSGITGSRFLSSIIRDIVVNLPVEDHAILKTFPLFVEGYIYERRN
jgi:hypothetical protein